MFLYIRLVQLLSFSVSLWDLLPFWVVALVWVCLLSQKFSVHWKCSAGVLDVGLKKKKTSRRRHTTTIISCCIWQLLVRVCGACEHDKWHATGVEQRMIL